MEDDRNLFRLVKFQITVKHSKSTWHTDGTGILQFDVVNSTFPSSSGIKMVTGSCSFQISMFLDLAKRVLNELRHLLQKYTCFSCFETGDERSLLISLMR